MKLSIITPYYKTLKQTLNLASHLEPQLTDEIEWIIVDDGTHDKELDDIKKARIVRLATNSGNASLPRNLGLFYAKGEYVTFIDSDDDVKDNYISSIMAKIEEGFDICYISWITDYGTPVIIEDVPEEWNCCVWNRVFKKSYLGDLKFDKEINYGEDKKFLEDLKSAHENDITKTTAITEPVYIYTWGREGSLSDLYSKHKIGYKKRQ